MSVIEDKLNQRQRIRLESIAQAGNFFAVSGGSLVRRLAPEPAVKDLIHAARQIEEYITETEPVVGDA